MVWVLVFGGIAVAALVMLVCYAVWLAHKSTDLLSEMGAVADRLGEFGQLVAQIQPAPASRPVRESHRLTPVDHGVGSEHQT